MSLLSKIKGYYSRIRNYHLSTSKSILIAGAMVSISILSGTEGVTRELDWSGRRMNDLLGTQNSYLYEIKESIKVAAEKSGAPSTLDQQTFDSVFEICISSTTEGLTGIEPRYNSAAKRHCLNKILKTDIK